MLRVTPIVLAVVLFVPPSSLAAQAPVEPEQEVRVLAPSVGLGRPTIGTVLDTRGDTLVIQTTGYDPASPDRMMTQRDVPLADVWSLEVPTGSRARVRGILVGGLAGTALGLAAALVDRELSIKAGEEDRCTVDDFSCVDPFSTYPGSRSVAITLSGTAVGLAAGALWPGRRWRHVLPVTPQASVEADGGVTVSGTVRF